MENQVIGRESEAERVAQLILESDRRLAVLHGSSGSGKTEFIRHWLMPALAHHRRRVYMGSCSPRLPERVRGSQGEASFLEALQDGSIVLLDNFDRFLSIPDAAQRQPAMEILGQLQQGRWRGTLVVTVREPMLAQLLMFREVAPSLLERLIEIKPIPFDEALERLNGHRSQPGVWYVPEAIERLNKEATSRPALDVIALVRAVDLGFQHFKRAAPSKTITASDVAAIGGVKGALSEFRVLRLSEAEAAFGEDGKRVCEAILRETVAAKRVGQAPDFSDLPPRLDVPAPLRDSVLSWLTEVNILKDTGGGRLELVLDPLADLILEESEGSEREIAQARKILADALRSWDQFNILLPWGRLELVHEARARLRVTDQEAALMARSCMAQQSSEDSSDLVYWLRRIRQPELHVSVLLEALFSPLSHVRVRAAQLLSDHDDPAVRSQLYRMALQDPCDDVRTQAVASLEKMDTSEIWPLLAREAQDPGSAERLNAIAALQIRKNTESAQLLGRLVADAASASPVRLTAIRTLARIQTPESVDALTAISLNDADMDDRQEAAKALSALGSKDLVRQALHSLRAPGRNPGEHFFSRFHPATAGRFLLTLLIVAGNVVFHGLGLIALGRYALGFAFLAFECIFAGLFAVSGLAAFVLLLANWATSHLAATSAAFAADTPSSWIGRRLHWPSGAFFLTGMPIMVAVHGTAHTVSGDWKRGLVLCVLEVLGLSCMTWVSAYFGTYGVSVPAFSDKTTELLSGLYYLFGIALFLGTIIWDVAPVMYRRFLFAGRLRGEAIRMSAYQQILGNRLAAESVFDSALGQNRSDVTWATRLIDSLAHVMPFGFLAELFEARSDHTPRFLIRALRKFRGDEAMETFGHLWTRYPAPRVRRLIVDVLAGDANESSLNRLRHFWDDLDWYGKARYFWASWSFRLRLWPKTMILIVLLALPVAALAMYEMRAYVDNPVRQLHKLIESEELASREPELVGGTARYLAERFPERSVDQLVYAFAARKNGRPELQESLADSLRILACHEKSGDIEERKAIDALVAAVKSERMSVAPAIAAMARSRGGCPLTDASRDKLGTAGKDLLMQPDASANAKRLALDTLESSGSAGVPAVLQRFILQEKSPRSPGSALVSPFRNIEFLKWRDELPLRRRALEILGRTGSAEAMITLRDITRSAPELRKEAGEQLERSGNEVVRSVQAELDLGNYDGVRVKGDRFLRVSGEGRKLDAPTHYRLLCLMGEANLARAALYGDADPTKRDQLEGEAVFYLADAIKLGGIDNTTARSILARVHDIRSRRFFSEKKLEPALAEANKAVEADAKSVEAHSTRGSVLLERGNRKEAFDAFALVTRLDPNLGWAYYIQSWIQVEQRNFDVSMGLALTAIEKGYQESGPYAVLRRCYTDQNKTQEAIAQFQQLRERYPHVQWPTRHLAAIYQDWAGDFEQAYQMLSKAEAEWKDEIVGEDASLFYAALLEVRFTTGRYREVIQGGPELLKNLKFDAHHLRIPINLLIYAAFVLDGDRPGALRQLDQFESALKAAPAGFRPTWRYSGTLKYMESKGVPPSIGPRLLDLVKAADAMRQGTELPPGIIEQNRAALKNGTA
jgi:tetratricopeptide (TPR) repeat protein